VNFGAVVLVDPANHYVYSPANVPGPPGFEWSSSRAVVGIRMTQSGLNAAQFSAKRAATIQALTSMLPSWMAESVGVGSEFVINEGVFGVTLL
jgi:hypothetical protein